MNNKKELPNVYFEIGILIIIIIVIIFAIASSINNKRDKKNYNFFGEYSNSSRLYNEKFEEYYGNNVSGGKVKELLDLIVDNNQTSNNIIGIDPNFISIDGTTISGNNNYDIDYISNTIRPAINSGKNYVIKESSLPVSILYSEEGYIQRITIEDQKDFLDKNVEEFNSEYTNYLGDKVSGIEVKNLIEKIRIYDIQELNNGNNKYIRLFIKLSSKFTSNSQNIEDMTGINPLNIKNENFLIDYINIIKEDLFYYVNVNDYHNDGQISVIEIKDSIVNE